MWGELDLNTSRWQWLFKWLLVLPHVFVLFFLWIAVFVTTVVAGFVGIFAGGFGFASGNLIGVLAIVAGAILLFTGRYPREIFDLLMGLNRWCYRVLAYVALMTDDYPPFRLDTGGTDPGSIPRTPPPVRQPRQPVTH